MPRRRPVAVRLVPGLLAGLLACPIVARARDVSDPCVFGGNVVAGVVEPNAQAPVFPARKRAWTAARGGEVAARPAVRARLAGWPAPDTVRRPPDDDAALEWALARDTWRGLEGLTDRAHHIPVDHVHLAPHDAATPPVGDYTNVTTIGLVMAATVGAVDLGLLDRAEAIRRLSATLDTLERLETHAGLFFNYYDTTTLERTSNLLSFVDIAWLTASLLVVRQSMPELAGRAGALAERGDWRLFWDPTVDLMYHGWWVKPGAPSRYHYGVLYTEARLGSVLAIGRGQVPASHWFAMARTFPAACDWQTQRPRDRVRKTVLGHTFWGGHYTWRGTDYVPSWGGSMFEALMPVLFLDEAIVAPASLGANARAHVAVQRRWSARVAGTPVWGLSPSYRPGGDHYAEFGARPLGIVGYPDGAIAPYAAALALAVDPAAALANLRRLAATWDVWGDWGMYDAVDPTTGAVARSYLTLDQAMTFLALANHLCQGCLQRRFAADPMVARALPVVAAERFFDD